MGAAQCRAQTVANAEVVTPRKEDDQVLRFKSTPSVVMVSQRDVPSEQPDSPKLRKTEPAAPAEMTLKDEALADFDRTLRVLGKSCFDRQDFEHFLKDTCGYGGDAGACFDELCGMVSKATTKKPVSQLDVAGMRALYDSRDYASVEDASKIAKQLMGAVGWLFDKYREEQDDRLTRDELSDLAEHLLSGRSLFDEVKKSRRGSMGSMPSRAMTGRMESKVSRLSAASRGRDADEKMADATMDAALEAELRELSRSGAAPAAPKKGVELPSLEEIDMMAAKLTDDPQGLISKDQLLRGLLRLDTASPDDELEPGICIKDLDPAHTNADQFVAAVEAWVLGHRTLEHHFLRSLSVGAFGGETAAKVAHYMKASAAFNQNFNRCVDSTSSLVSDIDPSYAEVLRATQDEEAGRYDEEGLRELQNLGLDVGKLKNVPHREVYRRTMDTIVKKSGVKLLGEDIYKTIAAPLVEAFAECCLSMECSAQTALAAVYFGSSLPMGHFYGKISARLLDDGVLTRDDIAFLLMHSGCDPQLQHMRPHVALLASSPYLRRKMLAAVRLILGARLQLLDNLVQATTAHTGHAVVQDGALHNQQVKIWARDEPTSLFDFTGHPVVHEFCSPHAKKAFVLDIGCGEGYDCRQLLKLGAAGTVGIDISAGMIKQAKQKAGRKEVYLNGNAVDLVDTLREKQAEVKIMPGADTTLGCFDLALAVFVFNYTTKTDMFSICRQAAKELKPGGHFVFSVPHPFMLQASHQNGGFSAFTLDASGVKGDQYFSLRDSKFAGQVHTVKGDKLNVKMTFHTVQDYFDAIKESGLEFVEMREASVKKEHMDSRKEFFDAIKDLPLHIVFKVRKPTEAAHAMHKSTGLDTLPKKLIWSALETKNAEKVLITSWPAPAEEALRNVVFRCVDEGIAVDEFTMTDALREELEPVAQVAKSMRAKIQDEVGADLIRGIDVEKWGGEANLELMTKRLKLAYYILASLIGRVDAGARGRLFDVKASGLSSNADNVLFSVSNTESGWHTDGASRDRIYDVVALLCVVPATSGGLLRLSNGCNAFESLKQRIPKFLLHELLRPIPRDVLENGSGKGHVDWLTTLARAPELLRLRVRMNSYPIYVEKGNNLAMRYMRFWIDTGFEKAGLRLSPLLRVAMDMLDEELDRAKLFEEALKPGDMCFCNNRQMLHARNDFTDAPGKPPRHQVRVWIQTQKV